MQRHSVLCQECSQFLAEICSAVVLRLILDVANRSIQAISTSLLAPQWIKKLADYLMRGRRLLENGKVTAARKNPQ